MCFGNRVILVKTKLYLNQVGLLGLMLSLKKLHKSQYGQIYEFFLLLNGSEKEVKLSIIHIKILFNCHLTFILVISVLKKRYSQDHCLLNTVPNGGPARGSSCKTWSI